MMMIIGRSKFIGMFVGLWLLAVGGCQTAKVSSLVIDQADWYTTLTESGGLTFGHVYLHLKGTASAEQVTVSTQGDGLVGWLELELDEDGNFDQHVEIAFTHAPDATPRTYSTAVIAYCGTETSSVPLTSPSLSFY